MKTGIIILAAGNSSRLGEPKQLLEYKGKSLLHHVTQQALKMTGAVVVVNGFNNNLIENELKNLQVITVYNPEWQEGMGSSIRDQPFINSSVFSELMTKHKEDQKGIIASAYAGVLGTPVMFDRKYFGELSKLSGNEGAKKLLHVFSRDVGSINFEKGRIDIDTKDDYEQLIQQNDIGTGS
jgi:molybdenum cofactor cytidylyltransferase